MDGGICSQMHKFLCGEYYAENGIDVYYDLEWFESWGKDMNGVFDRKYELQKLFPNLVVNTMSKRKTAFYWRFLRYSKIHCELPPVSEINRSIYFNGHNHLKQEDLNHLFTKCFSLSSMFVRKELLLDNLVGKREVCGVHVRRGDLADVKLRNYNPMPDWYFEQAIKYVQQHYDNVLFLFFSDEPEYVEQNILPSVRCEYKVIRGNKAYEDLALLAQCPIIISSQGSFGRYAAMLNANCKLVISNSQISPMLAQEVKVIM